MDLSKLVNQIKTSVIFEEYPLPSIIILSILAFLILLLIIKSLKKEKKPVEVVVEKKKEKKVLKEIPIKRTDQIDDPAMARFNLEAKKIIQKDTIKKEDVLNNTPHKKEPDIIDEELI